MRTNKLFYGRHYHSAISFKDKYIYIVLVAKIIIIENGGYLSIKQTLNRYFKGILIACGPECGLGIPNLVDLCKSYKISYSFTDSIKATDLALKKHLNKKGPQVFVVSVDKKQQFEPKPSSRRLKMVIL